MAKIYISSTFSDLKECREEASRALRKLGHDVIAMEDYTASDQRPLDKCLADVAASDVYVGIFAWRYGFAPPNQSKSITELEFREAVKQGKKCLLFLLDDSAPWPRNLIDREPEKIETLREELKQNYLVEFFSNKDDLARNVGIAVAKTLAAEQVKTHQPDEAERVRDERGPKEILGILKPIIAVFLSILAFSVLTVILCIVVPAIRNGIDLKLALSGLGGIFTFSSGFLMLTINKFVAASRGR
ncbi:MAG: DUF4062 domain-containing protein [Candidatus Binatia bacterium]